jgi:peroxiredoxin Q/BCP
MARSTQIAVGDVAPEFSLQDQQGRTTTLADLRKDRCVVLYFYPKDDTPGCTVEACSFRDQYTVFSDAGAEVVGISSDSVDDHKAFADKFRLPFRLLADRGGKVRGEYGVKKTLGLIDGRVTFIIDRGGVVRHVFSSQVRPKKHVEEALQIVRNLGST